MLTAISVARDCGMIPPEDRVIIADALPPKDGQSAKINWRYADNPTKHSNKAPRLEVSAPCRVLHNITCLPLGSVEGLSMSLANSAHTLFSHFCY